MLRRVLLIAAVVLFVASGIGFSTLHVGTVAVSLLAFGLACFAGAELTRA